MVCRRPPQEDLVEVSCLLGRQVQVCRQGLLRLEVQDEDVRQGRLRHQEDQDEVCRQGHLPRLQDQVVVSCREDRLHRQEDQDEVCLQGRQGQVVVCHQGRPHHQEKVQALDQVYHLDRRGRA